MYLQNIQKKIEKILKQKYNAEIIIKKNIKDQKCDFYLPLFPYLKIFHIEIEKIFDKFQKEIFVLEEIEEIFLQNGFCNIKLKKSLLSQKILLDILNLNDYYGQKKNNNQTIVLDYSSPNIAKNFSIGHLRSTIIGHALKNVYQKLGFQTISINHLGDWGTQFGKMILAYQKWGNPKKKTLESIDELQKLYILFHEKAQKDEKLNIEAREVFRQLEEKKKPIVDLWRKFKRISLKEFRKIYNLLGVSFDYYIGESFFHTKALRLLKKLHKQNLLVLDQKAYIMPLDGHLLPALIQKDNGSTLYLTRDIACVFYRFQKFRFQKCLYVVGNEQKLHYQQLKQVIGKMGYHYDLEHINFGLVLVKNMKISTRKNNDYKLIEIIKKVTTEAKKKISQKNPDLTEIDTLAQKIAIGAIIFNDLKNDRHLDIDFNLQQILQLEGDTGPYLQYTIVRLNSVLKKLNWQPGEKKWNWEKMNFYFTQPHYFILIQLMDQLDVVLEKTQQSNMPSILARYLLLLAQHANKFYAKQKILVNDNPILQEANIVLIQTIVIVLKTGLKIFSIPILEKM